MLLIYVRWGEVPFSLEVEGGEGAVLIFDPVAERQPSLAIGDRFRRLDPATRDVDAVLIRTASVQAAESLSSDPVLQTELQRVPVCLLTPVCLGEVVRMEVVGVKGLEFKAPACTMAALREAEVGHLISARGLVEKHDATHYILPSGVHASQFVDVGRLCRDPIDVSRLADWLLPHFEPGTAMVVDWGGLLALAQAVQLRMLEVAGWKPECDVLHGYPQDLAALAGRIEEVAHRQPSVRKLLLLLSVNSSGGLAALFREVTSHSCRPAVVCLVHTRASPATSVLDDAFAVVPIERWAPGVDGKCEKCDELPKVIGVEPVTLERRADLEWIRVAPRHEFFTANREFWQAASDAGAVALCVNREHRSAAGPRVRHHAVYLDIQRLLTVRFVRDCVLSKLAEKQAPDVVLIPEHEATGAIEGLVAEVYPSVPRFRLGPTAVLGSEVQRAIAASNRVLLCDDAIVTGETLLRLKAWVYGQSRQLRRNIEIDAFAPVARPPSEVMLHHIRRPFFRKPHGMSCAFEALLPSGQDCPWCEERTILQRLRRRSATHEAVIAERIRLLERGNLSPLSGEEGATEGAFAGNLSPVAAFAAASNVATVIRERLEAPGLMEVRILDVPMALSAFFDAALLGPLLRTLKAKHLRFAKFEEEIASNLDAKPADAVPESLVTELAWAAFNDKLPTAPVERLLAARADVGLNAFFREQIRARREYLGRPGAKE